MLHCHALFAGADGEVRGGHMRPGLCPLGPDGLVAMVAGLKDAGFQVAHDPETNFPIFHPKTADGEVLQ